MASTSAADIGVMSTYSFGDKELHIRNDGVFIRSLKQPEKSIQLSSQGWAKLITKLEEIDIEVRELNRKTRPVNYNFISGTVSICRSLGALCVLICANILSLTAWMMSPERKTNEIWHCTSHISLGSAPRSCTSH